MSYCSDLKDQLILKTEEAAFSSIKKTRIRPCCASSFLEATRLFASAGSSYLKKTDALCKRLDELARAGKCSDCSGVFIRAAFIYRGSVTDPQKRYHFEITVPNEESRSRLEERLIDSDISPKFSHRSQKELFYLKDSNSIEDILTLMGAQSKAMELMQTKVEKDVKNTINRINNSDSANIQKTVYFSGKIRDCVSLLKKHDAFDPLPENLKKAAALKLKYPGSSISELCLLSEEHITKSGMNHRLQKIIELAEKLEKELKQKEKK